MSVTLPPQLPRLPAEATSASATSSATAGPRPSTAAATQHAHAGLAPRAQGHSGTLAPRNPIGFPAPGRQEPRGLLPTIESMTQAVLNPSMPATSAALERLGQALMSPFMPSQGFQATTPATHQPAGPLPYVAPSVAGYQTVPLAQMEPADARAALLAMDISPKFLDAMKADLHHCTNPLSPGWRPESTQQFVAAYGQLVAMPNGLDANTVAALNRMLASPEPSTPQEPRGLLQTIESMTHAALNPSMPATSAALERLGQALMSPFMPSQGSQATAPATHQPEGPLPYVAPSVAGYQTVPLAQMEPADARAALLAMDISPKFLDAMKADLHHCTNPLSPGWRPESTQQFVAAYGHLVAMPNGLDANTVAALNRMLASPEPSTPQAARQQQALPVSEMAPEDARAALRAMEVPPQVLAAMKNDVLACVETAGSVEGQQRAQQFRQDYGHLLALPQHMNAETLTDLVNLVMDLEPQAAAQAARQREIPPSETRPIALGTMEPAAVLNALNLQGAELHTMMEHLDRLIDAESEDEGAADGGHEYNRLEGQFMQHYGHLFELPARLDLGHRIALGELLDEYVQRMQRSEQD